jgi:hypothetical protein
VALNRGSEQIFIITLADMQATQCPKIAQMEWGECSSIAEFTVGEDLWQEKGDKTIEFCGSHTSPPAQVPLIDYVSDDKNRYSHCSTNCATIENYANITLLVNQIQPTVSECRRLDAV